VTGTESVKPPNVTLADVAKLVGVSAVTVSNVVNNRTGVSDETRRRVWAAIEATGYVANPAARSLAGGKTNTIGVFVPDLTSQYASEIIRGASEEIRNCGMEMLVSTGGGRAEEKSRINFLSKISDGLLFLLPHESLDRSLELPTVLIEPSASEVAVATIHVDNYEGTKTAITYLIRLNHNRIGFIGGLSGRKASEAHLRAYRDTLKNAGMEIDESLVRRGDFSQPSGFAATCELLLLPEPPTAVFAVNDLTAFGAMEAIKHHGLRIPEDISVIGFDDIPMASQIFPALTTVRQPLAQMGVTAVKMLLAQIRHEAFESRITLPTNLIVRATTQTRSRAREV
jgi:LacI family transcriptional regulator